MRIPKTFFSVLLSGFMFTSVISFAQGELKSLVTDRANVLTAATEETLLKQLQLEEKQSGVSIYVLTVKAYSQKEIDNLVELAGKKPVAKGAKRGGSVLLVASPDSKKIKIVASEELEGKLNNELCTQLIKSEIVPSLKKGDYDTGMRAGANALQKAIRGKYVSRD